MPLTIFVGRDVGWDDGNTDHNNDDDDDDGVGNEVGVSNRLARNEPVLYI